jgi:hypothetical protein
VADVGRQVVEGRLVDAEVLREHLTRGVVEPVGDQERLVLGEFLIVHARVYAPLVPLVGSAVVVSAAIACFAEASGEVGGADQSRDGVRGEPQLAG